MRYSLIANPGALRFVLALAVLLNHITVAQTGRGAVMLFFVLSGYWVADLWVKTPGPNRIATFFLNRVLRIWPLYLAVMFFCAALRQHFPEWPELFLFGVASEPFPRLIGTEWSLDIEVQFYAMLPLLAAIYVRAPQWAWITMLAGAAIIGWWLEVHGVVTAIKFLPVFAIGMAIQRLRWTPTPQLARASLIAFIALSVGQIYLSQNHGAALHLLFGNWPDDAIAAIWVVALVPYVAASLHRPSTPNDRTLGDLSYPLYLVHMPVLLTMQEVYDWRTLPGAIALTVLIFAVTFVFWRAIDRPAERMRKIILASRPFTRRYSEGAPA